MPKVIIVDYYIEESGLLIFPPLIKSIISIIMKRIRVYCSIFAEQ